jgi:glycosyltransferase involved in cell wall biosynthesis
MNAKMLERVHFPGQVSRDDLPAYYRAADLYISTSHSDGTSISLLEALACATPVLLSDIPGNREWVTEPGQVGWLFRDGDVDSLSEGIIHAWESRSQLPAMGQAARRIAEARADWDKNFPQLFEAYQIALNRR